MKKIYCKPETDVIIVEAPQVLTTSSEEYPGPFGHIPGMDAVDDNFNLA